MLPRGGGMFPRREKIPRNRPVALQQAEVSEAIAPTLSSLPSDLLSLVAETCNRRELLDVQCLANFAAASTEFLMAAKRELRVSLLVAVLRCLEPEPGNGWMSDALVACPYFRLPRGLVVIPTGAFFSCNSLAKLALPDTLTTIGTRAFLSCCSLTVMSLPAVKHHRQPRLLWMHRPHQAHFVCRPRHHW